MTFSYKLKHIVIYLIAIHLGIPLTVAETYIYPYMVIEQNNSVVYDFRLNNDFCLRCDDNIIHISNSDTDHQLDVADIKSVGIIYIEWVSSGLSDLAHNDCNSWSIYDTHGLLIDSGENTAVNFSKTTVGNIYVVKADGKTFKYKRCK